MSFLGDAWEGVTDFVESAWSGVESVIESAGDLVSDGWEQFSESWDNTFNPDSAQTFAAEDIQAPELQPLEPDSYVPEIGSTDEVIDVPDAPELNAPDESSFNLPDGFVPAAMKVGGSMAAAYAADKARREQEDQKHENRMTELREKYRLGVKPISPWK